MNRVLGGAFEVVHLVGIAAVFGAAVIVTWLTSGHWLPDGLTVESATRTAGRFAPHLLTPVRVLAVAALVAAVLAPYLRSDGVKVEAWLRIATCATAVFMLWIAWSRGESWSETASAAAVAADVESRATAAQSLLGRGLTPWRALAAVTGLNLVFASFQIYRRGKSA